MNRGASNGGSQRLDIRPAYAVATDHLRRAIHLGEFKPGDKFLPERQHAEQLGISRVTLREAIRVLEAEGYVVVKRGSAGGVTVLGSQQSSAQLRQILRARLDELLDLQRFREVNERLAAELAAERATPSEIAELEATIVDLEQSANLGEFRQADSEFHLGIAAAARSPLLHTAIEQVRTAMFDVADALDPHIASTSPKAHRRILDAIRKKDAKAAGRAMESHIKRTSRELIEFTDE
ncbi:MAG TPA: FCD domain-containing protein [Solirubrobacterales bacterium]|jgi:DNA-binding FadR family transcriptional regulator|nr:FCD domain-containing protein [Solirubrobacterales bacterium]